MNRSGSYWGIYTNLQSPNQNISYKVIEQQQKNCREREERQRWGGHKDENMEGSSWGALELKQFTFFDFANENYKPVKYGAFLSPVSLLASLGVTPTQDCHKDVSCQVSFSEHSAWQGVGFLVVHSIISQVFRGTEIRIQVPDSKSTILSITRTVFLRLNLWKGEMGELIQPKKELEYGSFIDSIFFVLPFLLFFHDNPNKNPGLNPGAWGWLCGSFGSKAIFLLLISTTPIPQE